MIKKEKLCCIIQKNKKNLNKVRVKKLHKLLNKYKDTYLSKVVKLLTHFYHICVNFAWILSLHLIHACISVL